MNTYINVAGTYQKAKAISIKDGGVWKSVKNVWVKKDGAWVQVYQSIFSFNIVISQNVSNYNLGNDLVLLGWNRTSQVQGTLTVNTGVVVSGEPYAMTISDIPFDSVITLINKGSIVGNGGTGAVDGNSGTSGGHGIYVANNITIQNNNLIAAGGGGGGGGGNMWPKNSSGVCAYDYSMPYAMGGQGGRGAGADLQGIYPANQSPNAPTVGTSINTPFGVITGGVGGVGGKLGQVGNMGNPGSGNGCYGSTGFGGGAFTYPYAVRPINNAIVIWTALGTIYGYTTTQE